MAYLFATGSVRRGDIYYEDDAQGNTYIDWSEDAIGFVAGGQDCLVISGSSAISSSLNVSASGFYGDGSGLSGITATASPAGSNGQIQFNDESSTGGAAQLYWSEANNRLGIGTNNPSKALDIEAADSAGLQLNATNHRAYTLASDAYGFVVHDNTTGGTGGYRFVISDQTDYLGYVGIGDGVGIAASSHPKALLHLSSSDDQALLRVDTTGGGSATTVLFATGSGRVGIGTASPDYTLDVAGNAGFDEYIYHNGDADTFIRFQDDEINIKAGDVNFISIAETTQNKIVFNDGAADVDFIVRSPGESKALYLNAANEVFHINHGDAGFKTKIHSTNGEAVTVNEFGVIINEEGHAVNDFRVESDSNTHLLFVDAGTEKIGIGTSSPTSTFEISGSQAGNYTQTAGNITVNETHYVVDYTGNGNATFTLPATSGVTGRQYHILSHAQGGGDTLTVTGSGGEFQGAHLEGDAASVDIDGNTPQSITVLSTGTNWFILHDGRTQE